MRLGDLSFESPDQALEAARRLAETVREQGRACGLVVRLRGREYARAEIWGLLAAALGLSIRVRACERNAEGGWWAAAELVRGSDGLVVGSGWGYCGPDEESWARQPEFARASMAQTRAARAACRNHLGWVMALAGLETEAEPGRADFDWEAWARTFVERVQVADQAALRTLNWSARQVVKRYGSPPADVAEQIRAAYQQRRNQLGLGEPD